MNSIGKNSKWLLDIRRNCNFGVVARRVLAAHVVVPTFRGLAPCAPTRQFQLLESRFTINVCSLL
jgi:hypothetical protein